jgi:hypothetical protein
MARATGFCLTIISMTVALVWLMGRLLHGNFLAQ